MLFTGTTDMHVQRSGNIGKENGAWFDRSRIRMKGLQLNYIIPMKYKAQGFEGRGHGATWRLGKRSVVVYGFAGSRVAENVQSSANTSLISIKRSVVEEMLVQRFQKVLSTRSDSEIAAMLERDMLKEFPGWVIDGKGVDSDGPSSGINTNSRDSMQSVGDGGLGMKVGSKRPEMQGREERGTSPGPSSRIVYDDGGKGYQSDDGKDETADLLMTMGKKNEAAFSSIRPQDDDVSSAVGRASGQQPGNRSLERLVDVESWGNFPWLSGSTKDIAVPIMSAGFVVIAFSVAVSLLLGVMDGNQRDEVSESEDAVKKNHAGSSGTVGFFRGILSKKDDDDDGKEGGSLAVDSRQEIIMPSSDPYKMYKNDPETVRADGGVLWKRREDHEDQVGTIYSEKEDADLWRMPLEDLRSDAMLTKGAHSASKENSSSLVVEHTAELKSVNANGNEIESEEEELRPRRKPYIDVLDNAEQTIVSPRRRG
eukprot:jgi/Picsp_1/6297/NSC_03647-R1_---NA---